MGQQQEKQISQQIKVSFKIQNLPQLSLHQIAINQKGGTQGHNQQVYSYAVQFQQFKLSFLQINEIMGIHQRLQQKVQMYQEMLKNFDWDSYALELSSHQNQANDTQNIQSLLKKAKKYKQIKQENKKLKKLLQIQLDNTQKVREQTQKTMKILRNQFNALVNQMVKQRQRKQTNQRYAGQEEEFIQIGDSSNQIVRINAITEQKYFR